MTVDDLNLALNEILLIQNEVSNLIGHIHNRNKRSLLPLGGLLSFLSGTGDQADINAIKLILNSCIKAKWIIQMYSMTS